MTRYWLSALLLFCFVYAVNARSDCGDDNLQSSVTLFTTVDHHQQVDYNNGIDEDEDLVHVTYWGRMFFSPPLLTNTTLLWVTGMISAIVWCSGYTIECLLDRQERLAMELGKQKQHVPLYGAVEA